MTHPTREDWMSYLYDELSPEQRSEMSAHLGACAACAGQVKAWRGAAGSLDAFKLPSRPSRGRAPVAVKWAMAAALVLFAGLAAARVATLQREVNQMRADLNGAMRQQIERQFPLFDESVEITVTVGASAGEDLVVERHRTRPKPYLPYRVARPITPPGMTPARYDDLALTCEVVGQDAGRHPRHCLWRDRSGP